MREAEMPLVSYTYSYLQSTNLLKDFGSLVVSQFHEDPWSGVPVRPLHPGYLMSYALGQGMALACCPPQRRPCISTHLNTWLYTTTKKQKKYILKNR